MSERVCPRCGTVATGNDYCSQCGLHLAQQFELPTREEWVAEHGESAGQGVGVDPVGAPSARSRSASPAGRPGRRLAIGGAAAAVVVAAAIIVVVLMTGGGGGTSTREARESVPSTGEAGSGAQRETPGRESGRQAEAEREQEEARQNQEAEEAREREQEREEEREEHERESSESPMESREAIVGVLEEYAAAYTAQSTERLGAIFTSNVTRRGLASGGCQVSHGKEAVLADYESQFALDTGTYELTGLSPAAVVLEGDGRASANSEYSITPGGTGSVSFNFDRHGEEWLISHIGATCE